VHRDGSAYGDNGSTVILRNEMWSMTETLTSQHNGLSSVFHFIFVSANVVVLRLSYLRSLFLTTACPSVYHFVTHCTLSARLSFDVSTSPLLFAKAIIVMVLGVFSLLP
jgi:hypothetical protein